MKNKKITEGFEIKKEYGPRNYGKKEDWKLAEMILIMESGDNVEIAIKKTNRKKNSVSYFIDGVYNEIGKRCFSLKIGFSNNTKMFEKAYEIAEIHSSFYKSVSKRIGKRLKELKIERKEFNIIK